MCRSFGFRGSLVHARYVIAGSGVAAIAAAEAIREIDAEGEITLVSDDPHGYYSRPGLAYYLTGELPRSMLFPLREADFKRLGLRRVHARITHLEVAEHRLVLADASILRYDRLLLATGAQAVVPGVSGHGLAQVVKLDHLNDADRMLRLARRANAAVVVGGGITAVEIVEGLRHRCRRVHYLLRGERYWSSVLDETESRIVTDRLAADGVHLHFGTEIAEIVGTRGSVSGILTTAGERIECDLVAVAVGVAPRADLARGAGLLVERGVLVDGFLQTSSEDVYAAGDVAQVYDATTGKSLLDTLWNMARSQGTFAGKNMAGRSECYIRAAPLNVTRLAGLTTTIIGTVGHGRDADLAGIVRGDSETWRELRDALAAEDHSDVNRVRLLVGQRTLVGAVVMGDQTLSRPLQQMIAGQVDITPIRDQLVRAREPLAALLTRYVESSKSEAGVA